jgi:phage gp29-like protein
MAAPFGTTLEVVEPKSTGEFFKQSIDDCNLEIDRAILYQTMASGEAQHGNLGSGGTADAHQDIMELPIKYGKQRVAHMIAWDICMDLIQANWGTEAMELCPTVSLGDVESHNFAEMGKTLASLGYSVDMSQFEDIDTDLGMPQRASGWQQKAEDAAAKAAAPAKKETAVEK